jgi:hypothetical protein
MTQTGIDLSIAEIIKFLGAHLFKFGLHIYC